MAGGFGRSNPDMLSIGAIPDDMFDVLINSAIDRLYTGSSAQPGDSELLRHGGMRPGEEPQRPVGHRNEWVRDEIDRDERGIPDWVIADGYPAEEGTGVDMRARMEEQWREPDDMTLDSILSKLEGGGEPSANDSMLLDMMKVDGFGDGQEDLQERYDHQRMQQFPEMDYGEQPIWGGDSDEWPPGWNRPSPDYMKELAAQIANSQRPQMGARGDRGGPMGAYPSIEGGGGGGDLDAVIDILIKEMGERSGSARGARVNTETPSPAWDNLYEGMGRRLGPTDRR